MKRGYRIAIVDDVKEHSNQIHDLLITGAQRYGKQLAIDRKGLPVVDTFELAEPILDLIQHKRPFPYDIIIADLYMPKGRGHAVGDAGARRIYDSIIQHKLTGRVVLVVTTNRGEGQDQIAKMFPGNQTRLSWAWYIPKAESMPLSGVDLISLTNESYIHKLWQAIAACRDRDWKKTFVSLPADAIVGHEPRLLEAQSQAERFASEGLVLLIGEEGTGKEAVAQILHESSGRTGPFLSSPCDAFLRGEVRRIVCGTAAIHGMARQEGLLYQANHGTLYLGKVGEDLDIAEELCEVLNPILNNVSHPYSRMGGYEVLHFDGAIVLGVIDPDLLFEKRACHSVLELAETFQIRLPRLRERRDLIGLANHFLAKYASEADHPPQQLSDTAQEMLRAYSWPGNIAELDKKMRYCALHISDKLIEASHFRHWRGFTNPAAGRQLNPTSPFPKDTRSGGRRSRRTKAGRRGIPLVEAARRCSRAHQVILEFDQARQDFRGRLGAVVSVETLSKQPIICDALKVHAAKPLGVNIADYQEFTYADGIRSMILDDSPHRVVARFTISRIAIGRGAANLQASVADLQDRRAVAIVDREVIRALVGNDVGLSAEAAYDGVLDKVIQWIPPYRPRRRGRSRK